MMNSFVYLLLFRVVLALESSGHAVCRRRYVGNLLTIGIASVSERVLAEKDELFDQNTVCGRRGILGKCIEDATESDTIAPSSGSGKASGARLLEREESSSELIDRLRKQSEENRVRNDRKIELESFANSQSGLFGPFSRYEPVMKTDGSFVLVLARDFERLKKEKRIVDGCFVDDADAKPYEKRASPSTLPTTREDSEDGISLITSC